MEDKISFIKNLDLNLNSPEELLEKLKLKINK
jgi:hypothetical protein